MRDPVCCRPVPMMAGLLLVLLAPGLAPAQSNASQTDKLTTLRLEWLTQLARQDAANWEADLISAPRGNGLTVGSFRDPNAVLKELGPVLEKDYLGVRNRLVVLDTKVRARREQVQKEWAEVYRQRMAFRQYAEKRQAAYGFGFESGSPVGFQPSFLDALLLIWAGAVAMIALRLRLKENRLAFRKARRAAVAALLVGLVVLPGCGGPTARMPDRGPSARKPS